jgi:hypothetical protein
MSSTPFSPSIRTSETILRYRPLARGDGLGHTWSHGYVFLISLTDAGSTAWYRDKIYVFQSIPAPSDAVSYPKKFASLRYPQMLKKLAARRAEFMALERKREKLLKTAPGAKQK